MRSGDRNIDANKVVTQLIVSNLTRYLLLIEEFNNRV